MNIKSTPTVALQLETLKEEEIKIIFLNNSNHYLLEYVFILFEEEGYRLVVNRGGEILTNKNYKTVKGAKTAFLKFHGLWAVMDDVRPIWSHVYTPPTEWLDQILGAYQKLSTNMLSIFLFPLWLTMCVKRFKLQIPKYKLHATLRSSSAT